MVVVPSPVREALAEHARRELPNESCGLLVLRDRVADRYEPGRNAADSPYRFELEVDPELWFLEDEGCELAVVHVARRLAGELEEGVVVCVLADGGWKYLSAGFWQGDEVDESKLWW